MKNPKNMNNYGIVQGKLVHAPYVNDRKGGKSVRFAVKCPDSYETRDEKGRYIQTSQHVQITGYIPSYAQEKLALLESLAADDVVRVLYTVHTNNYVNKQGEEVRGQTLELEDLQVVEKGGGSIDVMVDTPF